MTPVFVRVEQYARGADAPGEWIETRVMSTLDRGPATDWQAPYRMTVNSWCRERILEYVPLSPAPADAQPLFKTGDYVESLPNGKPRVAGIVKWCGKGPGATVGLEDERDRSEWDFDVDQLRIAHRQPPSFTRKEIEAALGAALRKSRDKGADSHQENAIVAFGQDMLAALSPAPAFADPDVERTIGCKCHWEEGDSPCPVHGENEDADP